MNNKAAGTKFEQEFAVMLADSWFWVHLFQDNKNGQPCDVIAAKNGKTYLFDCKDCQKGIFPLSRMEENQYNAMYLFELTGNSRGMFAIRFPSEEVYLVEYQIIKDLREQGIRQIGREECRRYGKAFADWMFERNAEDGWGDKDGDCYLQ